MREEMDQAQANEEDFSAAFGTDDQNKPGDEPETDAGEQIKAEDDTQDQHSTGGDSEGSSEGNHDEDPNSQTWEQRYKTLQGKYNAEISRRNEHPPAEDKPATTDDTDELDEAERAMDEDFPEMSRGFAKKAERIAREVEKRIRQDMAPVVEVSQKAVIEEHFKAIRDKHADFDDIVTGNSLASWVTEQPSFVRDRYEQVMARGNAQSVIEMVDAYKKSRGITKPHPTKQSGDDLAVRTRSRASIPAGEPNKDDFSAGFNS